MKKYILKVIYKDEPSEQIQLKLEHNYFECNTISELLKKVYELANYIHSYEFAELKPKDDHMVDANDVFLTNSSGGIRITS